MSTHLYRYTFSPDVPLADVEASILLAIWAAESLHGETDVRLDAGHYLNKSKRACVIDASTDVGRDLNRLFVGFLRRELGEDAFRIERLETGGRGKAIYSRSKDCQGI